MTLRQCKTRMEFVKRAVVFLKTEMKHLNGADRMEILKYCYKLGKYKYPKRLENDVFTCSLCVTCDMGVSLK